MRKSGRSTNPDHVTIAGNLWFKEEREKETEVERERESERKAKEAAVKENSFWGPFT